MRRYYLRPRYPRLKSKCRFRMGIFPRRGFQYRRRKQAGLTSNNPNPDPAEQDRLLQPPLGSLLGRCQKRQLAIEKRL
jgi:hypothetical protein